VICKKHYLTFILLVPDDYFTQDMRAIFFGIKA